MDEGGLLEGIWWIAPSLIRPTGLCLDREVLDFFQADGPGWQERINAALRKVAGK
ncbi:MAG: hypothetical protein GC182_06705 [Rhodopseudomonas sp.]|nr:hypothetical protein [Rhodopseudomonas sp.]